MQPKRPKAHRPKISTMPRQRSESAQYLDLYKLTVERKRLQRELSGLEQRCQQIKQRLATIDAEVNTLENTAQHLRAAESGASQTPTPTSNVFLPDHPAPSDPFADSDDDSLDTMTLDY